MKVGFRKTAILAAALSFAALSGPAARADSIDPGDTISDSFDRFETKHTYKFDGNEDDYVTIIVLDAEDESSFYPMVELSGPYGFCASDTDSRAAMIRCYKLREDGEYKIKVSRMSFFEEGDDYVLSFVSSGDLNDGGEIEPGDSVSGEISPDGDIDAYRFHAQKDDRVTIRVIDLEDDDDFDPYVDLIGPDGLVESDSDDRVAEIVDEELDETGDYTIVVWGGDPEWGGGRYELSLTTPATEPTPTPTPTPLPLPELRIAHADAGPAAPTRLRPGDDVVLGAYVENLGQPAGPFWLEFWASRTGGLTLDAFVADSQYIPGLGLFGTYPFEQARPLYALPDGPYTVVAVVDRPDMVAEWDESNNRVVIGGKRLLVIRPQSDVDLVVENFGVNPWPPQAGGTVHFSGTVRNAGSQDSGFFWIEFWSSPPTAFPILGAMIADSIGVDNLAPGEAVDLAGYPRTIYWNFTTPCHVGVFADRPDWVNESDETNNYRFVRWDEGASTGATDLAVVAADFDPAAPSELRPGSAVSFTGQIANLGPAATGPFWLEFWGSRTGGLTLDRFLADSIRIAGLAPGETYQISLTKSLYAIPDGPYTVVVAADRPGQVSDGNRLNNRAVVGRKKLLIIRPQTRANLTIEGFRFGRTKSVTRGQRVTIAGVVKNTGTESCGPFWIEFWGSRNQQYPNLGWYMCDSIWVGGLAPGAQVDLSAYERTVYDSMAQGPCAIGCFVDRTDLVNETDESDNYVFERDYQIY